MAPLSSSPALPRQALKRYGRERGSKIVQCQPRRRLSQLQRSLHLAGIHRSAEQVHRVARGERCDHVALEELGDVDLQGEKVGDEVSNEDARARETRREPRERTHLVVETLAPPRLEDKVARERLCRCRLERAQLDRLVERVARADGPVVERLEAEGLAERVRCGRAKRERGKGKVSTRTGRERARGGTTHSSSRSRSRWRRRRGCRPGRCTAASRAWGYPS